MTYDSLFWAIEGEVIPEVANFKEECLVTPEGWEGEKSRVENLLVHRGNWTLAQMYLQPHYSNGVFGNVYLSAGQQVNIAGTPLP